MEQNRPSATAWRVALRRAAHQLIDTPIIFDDPFAVRIVGEKVARDFVAADENGEQGRRMFSRALRAFVVARSRFAEEHLAAAIARGVRQVVVLGAGLDTFGLRNKTDGVRVFEVDFPATQEWKRHELKNAGLETPASLTFVPTDFEKQTIADTLPAAGFRAEEPAYFSWLGVVPYLTLDAFRQTLRYIGARAKGSMVAFDYAISLDSLDPRERLIFEALANRVALVGEPFKLFISPEMMVTELAGVGMEKAEELDSAGINARYFAGRADGLQVSGKIGRLLAARTI